METVIKHLDGTDYKQKEYKQIGSTPVVVEEKVVTVRDIISNVVVQGMKDTKQAMDIWGACTKAQEKGIEELDVKEKSIILKVVEEIYKSPLIQGRMNERFNDGVQEEEGKKQT